MYGHMISMHMVGSELGMHMVGMPVINSAALNSPCTLTESCWDSKGHVNKSYIGAAVQKLGISRLTQVTYT